MANLMTLPPADFCICNQQSSHTGQVPKFLQKLFKRRMPSNVKYPSKSEKEVSANLLNTLDISAEFPASIYTASLLTGYGKP